MGNTVVEAHKAFLRLPETAVGRALIPTAQSLRDVAYQCIKHLIVTGVLKPGDYINEATLSSRLDVGRTPVHQAIDRLVGDSLVEVIPRKGIVIKPLSLDEIFQTLDVRILNETAAAEKAGDNAGLADIEALRRLIDLFSQAAQKSDFVRMMYLDREFHLIIAHASGNPVLAEILRGIHDRSLRFWLTSVRAPMRYDDIVREHTAIVDAIVAREKQAASGAMRRHIESARDSLVRHMSMQIAV